MKYPRRYNFIKESFNQLTVLEVQSPRSGSHIVSASGEGLMVGGVTRRACM
jgi:hypothetical protein